MAPTRKSPRKLGRVASNRGRFRVRLRLNPKEEDGPWRTREAAANADLALVIVCLTREEIPRLLARLRAEAEFSTEEGLPGDGADRNAYGEEGGVPGFFAHGAKVAIQWE